MAVIKSASDSVLAIKVEAGLSAGGTQLYKYLRYKNIKTDATDDNLFAVGSGIAGLQTSAVDAVQRVDTADLINAG